jgi:hypothetical protein
MTYPDGIDALVNVNANDTLAAGGHAARHNSVNTALVEIKNMLGPSPAGKIIQIVRATDSTNRSTTSTSFVDASISVTITPQKSNSAILLVVSGTYQITNGANTDMRSRVQITDSSNNAISGAESSGLGQVDLTRSGTATVQTPYVLMGWATPAVITAVTYKLRFRAQVTSQNACEIRNGDSTGQMFAIEVSA